MVLVYALTAIGTLNILYGFITKQFFYTAIGFIWNITTLILADKLETISLVTMKKWENENYFCHKRRK